MTSINKSLNKKPLKEKFVQIYEAFFKNQDPSIGNKNFWDELFLLRVNSNFIEEEIKNLNGEQIVVLVPLINKIFKKCVEVIQKESNIRTQNAILTIIYLIKSLNNKLYNSGDLINILIGFDHAPSLMKDLLTSINFIIICETSNENLKSYCLCLLVTLVTGMDNLNENLFLDFFMINSVFESIVKLLSDISTQRSLGLQTINLLSTLLQFKKYQQSANPYILKLSLLDDELSITGLAQIISSNLYKYIHEYELKLKESESNGFLSSISNIVGNILVGGEEKIMRVRRDKSTLILLYEAFHLNRNFATTLSLSHTQPVTPHTPESNLNSLKQQKLQTFSTSSTSGLTETETGKVNESGEFPAEKDNKEIKHSNLLVTLIEFSSIVCQDIKDPDNFQTTKLLLIILTIITEDPYSNSLLHDNNINFRVHIFQTPMRHRKAQTTNEARPLICSLIDMVIEFILSHLMKNFPMELHLACLGIIQRIICYEKKCKVRLNYSWSPLWHCLISLLRFILNNQNYLIINYDIFLISIKIINIINMFITYGDSFLSDPSNYDYLYYEIIRNQQIFHDLYQLALKYINKETTSTTNQSINLKTKEHPVKLNTSLINIRAIINHFNPKINQRQQILQVAGLTEIEVLDVVKTNYDSLTLRMEDFLDQYPKYFQNNKNNNNFFISFVKDMINEIRQNNFIQLKALQINK